MRHVGDNFYFYLARDGFFIAACFWKIDIEFHIYNSKVWD
jgi:hypothetical protein